jgi:hypothetical protein
VLTDHYNECSASRPQSSSVSLTSSESLTCGCISVSGFQSRSHELLPEPQARKKGLRLRTNHRRKPLWTRIRHNSREDQQSSVDGNMLPRFTEISADSCRQHTPGILCHPEGLTANKRSAGPLEPTGQEKSTHTLQRLASKSSSHGYRSLLVRLPRGFALVRLSSVATSRSEATDSCHFIPRENQRQKSSAASEYPWRRSTWYDSSSPTSPFALEFPHPLPVSPIRTPKSQSIDSPLSQASKTWVEVENDNILPDEEFIGRGLVNRARDVRDAWRRRQMQAKHDKLKQSIKVLGLTDPPVASRYTKSWGRRSGDRSD